MRMQQWLRRAAAFGALGAALALVLLAAHEPKEARGDEKHGQLHKMPKGLRYPAGVDIQQSFVNAEGKKLEIAAWGGVETASVMGAVADSPAVKEANVQLRPRTIVRILEQETAGPEAAAEADTPAKEQLGYYEFDLLYDQQIPVTKASRSIVVKDGAQVLVRDRNFPKAALKLESVKPTVSFDAVRDLALINARKQFAEIYPTATVVLAVETSAPNGPRLEVLLDKELTQGSLVWSFSVTSATPGAPFLRHYWAAAQQEAKIIDYEDRIYNIAAPRPRSDFGRSGPHLSDLLTQPLEAGALRAPVPLNRLVRADLHADDDAEAGALIGTHGRVEGTVWKTSPAGGTETVRLPHLTVTLTKNGVPHVTATNAQGRYGFPGIQGNVIVSATLAGPFCRIINDETPGAPVLSVHKSGQKQINLELLSPANNEFELAQIDAFKWVNTVHDYVKGFAPQNAPILSGMATHVNINQTCNAFYSPGNHSLNFFRGNAGGCPNTAYSDVAFHEYGHAVDDQLGGILDGGYSEGFGDSLAILITRQSIIGRDFFGPNQHLRDASEVHKWPDVQGSPDPHVVGEAYNGFTWELTRQLKTQYPASEARAFAVARKLILGAAVLNPQSIPDAVALSFRVDALLYPVPGGKSRHYNQLKAAADSRAIPIPP